MKTTRVVLADDHLLVRTCLRQLLQDAPDIEVVGEAGNGLEAIQVVKQLNPDVLLLDMEMPVMDGVAVASNLQTSQPEVRILALSAYDDRQYVVELFAHGAAGYLTKDEAAECVIDAIRKVAQGETGWISQRARESLALSTKKDKERRRPYSSNRPEM
jgi:DNA-binding NarL/FixJ family response regulator